MHPQEAHIDRGQCIWTCVESQLQCDTCYRGWQLLLDSTCCPVVVRIAAGASAGQNSVTTAAGRGGDGGSCGGTAAAAASSSHRRCLTHAPMYACACLYSGVPSAKAQGHCAVQAATHSTQQTHNTHCSLADSLAAARHSSSTSQPPKCKDMHSSSWPPCKAALRLSAAVASKTRRSRNNVHGQKAAQWNSRVVPEAHCRRCCSPPPPPAAAAGRHCCQPPPREHHCCRIAAAAQLRP